jgi:hypothetical protein
MQDSHPRDTHGATRTRPSSRVGGWAPLSASVLAGLLSGGAFIACGEGGTQVPGQSNGPVNSAPVPSDSQAPGGTTPSTVVPPPPLDPTGVIIDEPGAAGAPGSSDPEACTGLECQKVSCPDGQVTRLGGTVFAPSGTLPLYNVMAYVPNGQLAPLTEGASCNRCDTAASGDPVASAISGTDGAFLMEDVPVGQNIPLVLQVGKWRRQVTVPEVLPCVDNTLTDVNLTRLPGSQAEGDMPKIALTTGELDALECLLRKLGIADSEFTPRAEGGRVTLFAGHGGTSEYSSTLNAGAEIEPAQELWGDLDLLRQYDVLLMACEGGEYPQEKSDEAREVMQEYANVGGRVFMSHWHKIWLEQGPEPFPELVNFVNSDTDLTLTADVDMTFPKGQALAEWLVHVQGSTETGTVDLVDAQDTAESENPELAQRWIYTSADPTTVQYVSANTPLGVAAEDQCGRIVYSNIHVTTGNSDLATAADDPGVAFPEGCMTTGLTPQEKVLAFMLFDLSACLIPDDEVPRAPQVR